MTSFRKCIAVWHGRVPYEQALRLQMRICELKKAGYEKDVLLLLEHPPTVTLGRNAVAGHLLAGEDQLETRGVSLFHVDRGGDITFHGPGQLVGYPVLSLQPGERDVHAYMRNLEESIIRLLERYGIPAHRDHRFTGVWTTKGKIAAMGVHISRWITRHGFALNVGTDLSFFELIVPCGIVGRGVSSVEVELERTIGLKDVAARYIQEFSSVFNRDVIPMTAAELEVELQSGAGEIKPGAPSQPDDIVKCGRSADSN